MAARALGVGRALIGGVWVDGDVLVDDGRIAAVGVTPAAGGGLVALPGFVDLQLNGFAGVDFSRCDSRELAAARTALARAGVTAFLLTIPTADPERYHEILRVAADAIADDRGAGGARPLGVHLEGPFLSPQRPGAHRRDWLRAPEVARAEQLLSVAPVTVMTLAPELRGAVEVITMLRSRGVVVAAGHTDATADEAHRAFDGGVTMVTHLWNAQRPITSREPGLAGVALVRPDVHVGIIGDGVHLSLETLAISMRAAAGRGFLVSDAVAAAGLGDGEHVFGGRTVHVRHGAVRLPDGTLAGSAAGIDAGVRNLSACGWRLEDAVAAATAVPARAIGRTDVGTLEVGGRADVVVLDEELAIARVLVAGAEV